MSTTTTLKEKPILFSGEMVRAILAGKKTQTRRVIKHQPPSHVSRIQCDWMDCGVEPRNQRYGFWNEDQDFPCPYGAPGDRLWVRETFITGWPMDDGEFKQFDDEGNQTPQHVWYRADSEPTDGWISNRGAKINSWVDENDNWRDSPIWRPSIYMPRWASRITLEITEVRVQRLQEITPGDARAEGVPTEPFGGTLNGEPAMIYPVDPVYQFGVMWNGINGKRPGCDWNANPWVWAVSFKVI